MALEAWSKAIVFFPLALLAFYYAVSNNAVQQMGLQGLAPVLGILFLALAFDLFTASWQKKTPNAPAAPREAAHRGAGHGGGHGAPAAGHDAHGSHGAGHDGGGHGGH